MYLHKLAGHALLEGSGQRPCAKVRVGVAGGVLLWEAPVGTVAVLGLCSAADGKGYKECLCMHCMRAGVQDASSRWAALLLSTYIVMSGVELCLSCMME